MATSSPLDYPLLSFLNVGRAHSASGRNLNIVETRRCFQWSWSGSSWSSSSPIHVIHHGRAKALNRSQQRHLHPACPQAGGNVGQSDGSSKIGQAAKAATSAEEQLATELLEAAEAALGRPSRSSKSEVGSFELTAQLLKKLVTASDAQDALACIVGHTGGAKAGSIGISDCARIIEASAARGNSELALSILDAMQATALQPRNDSRRGGSLQWEWPPADVGCYVALVRGLAAALRVQDAVEAVESLRRRGVPQGDEVPFGKVVDCPTCRKSLAVVQPQNGVQVVACSRCRYQYELMSGDVVTCESESISSDASILERGLRLVRLRRRPLAAATHSMVVRAPDGNARTHRFATESADIPAQPGERVSVVSAAPEAAKKRKALGLYAATTRAPGWRPDEPMALTNHVTGKVSALVRAPPKEGTGAAFETSWLLPAALLLATSDAATGFIDPALPSLVAAGAASAALLGGVTNTLLLPRLNQLPQRSADAVASRQLLLEQHTKLEQRLQELSQAAAGEVRMLARMWQLQNKMEAVGEPATYSSRMERVQLAREGLDERLTARLELIDSYAKIASMIEIEVEMDSDLLAAEAAGAAANIAEQIERLEEVDALQKEWRFQAEANDEVERLLRNAPPLPD